MQEVLRYALLGLGIGALYALTSQGLLLIYRGSGVLNFAHGAIGMVGAYVEYVLQYNHGWPFVLALLVGIVVSGLLGAMTHLLVMRPLRRASPLARVVATLGVLIVLESIGYLKYANDPLFPNSELGVSNVHITGDVQVPLDRLVLTGIAIALSAALYALYRYTKFGLGTAAVAENERAAASLGWSPDVIATANWALGSALAGVAAILVAPIVTLQVSIMTDLVLAAMATALVASFKSFPIALVAGLVIGIVQTEIDRYAAQPGLGTSFPFFVIVVVMVLRGRALPLRDFFLQRLPRIGTGRTRLSVVLLAIAAGVVLMQTTSAIWVTSFTVDLGTALILLSIVVLTGYGGQLSLAQYSMAGFGAWVAGKMVATQGAPFWLAVVVGALATAPLGVLFALPAVRTRGLNLAVVTLGLGSALEYMLFDNPAYTGGFAGTTVSDPHLFGIDINTITHANRFGLVTLGCFVLAALAVSNVRRGRSGRRLIAVRTNERAAAALGINVISAKLYAFALAGSIAGLGGILLAFQSNNIIYSSFDNFTSITDVGLAVIGGIGYIFGPVIGATLAPGSVSNQVFDVVLSAVSRYLPLIGGGILILVVLESQDGAAEGLITQLNWFGSKVRPRLPARLRIDPRPPVLPPERRQRVKPRTLEVHDLTVRFGPVVAVKDVSLRVEPGKVVGLIGPNGAGKTTFIDAVTGFTRTSSGSMLLDGRSIAHWSPVRRARAGMSRSFQSLELFEDATVFDNLRVASDPRDLLSYALDLICPISPKLPGEVSAAIREFGLESQLSMEVQDLPFGRRRLLAIARAVATRPSVLLLDEPAAGLGDIETAELGRLVRRLADEWGMSILLIEHDMNFVMNVCDEVVVLDFGRKLAEGIPADVRQNAAVIAAYLGTADDDGGTGRDADGLGTVRDAPPAGGVSIARIVDDRG